MSPVILLKIFDDPEHRWTGVIRAELTAYGLLLRGLGEDVEYLVPLGCDAQWPCSTYLHLPCVGRTVTVTVAQSGTDQTALARDLASWIQCKKYRIDLAEYRLPAYLRLLAFLPMVLPVVAIRMLLHGDLPFHETWWLRITSICGIGVSLILFFWSFLGFPTVRARVIIILLVALLCNGIVGTIWAHHEGRLLDALALLPGGPGTPFAAEEWTEFVDPKKKFTIEMPGKPKQSSEPLALAKIKDAFTMHGVEYWHTAYAIGHVDLPGPWSRMPIQERFDDARKGMVAQMGTVAAEENVTQHGFPGREYHVVVPKKGNLVVRHLIVDTRLYFMIAGAPRYTPQTPDVRRFISSFRLTDAIR